MTLWILNNPPDSLRALAEKIRLLHNDAPATAGSNAIEDLLALREVWLDKATQSITSAWGFVFPGSFDDSCKALADRRNVWWETIGGWPVVQHFITLRYGRGIDYGLINHGEPLPRITRAEIIQANHRAYELIMSFAAELDHLAEFAIELKVEQQKEITNQGMQILFGPARELPADEPKPPTVIDSVDVSHQVDEAPAIDAQQSAVGNLANEEPPKSATSKERPDEIASPENFRIGRLGYEAKKSQPNLSWNDVLEQLNLNCSRSLLSRCGNAYGKWINDDISGKAGTKPGTKKTRYPKKRSR